MKIKMLDIDGSLGEGGGAILRIAAGFSYLYNRPINIKNIRANRPKPGLRTQHLLGLKLITELTKSRLSDCKVGTEELTFIPNSKQEFDNYIHVNISTAASLGLLLQPIQIASLGFKTKEKIEISLSGGGTFGKWAPSLSYLQEVTYKIFKDSGLNIKLEIKKQGFYPKGGARITCTILPPKNNLKSINLTELGAIKLIQGEIIISNELKQSKDDIGARIKKSIQRQIKRDINVETDIKIIWVDSTSPGVGLSLWSHSDTGAIISTGTILGERRIRSEVLGKIAATELLNYIKNDIPVDNYLSDQLIPIMAYIKGPSRIKVLQVTNHTQTNLKLVKLFTQRDYRIIKEKTYSIIEYL
ncbi:MAG: RNA 3'-terminal phosphate cyclase [Promethearchaeota archaeon]|jgi:RNA 3'-terminal phosphate cyclase (ATP)/RNA 3'-terminal phosphate cyclase (GTP)